MQEILASGAFFCVIGSSGRFCVQAMPDNTRAPQNCSPGLEKNLKGRKLVVENQAFREHGIVDKG